MVSIVKTISVLAMRKKPMTFYCSTPRNGRYAIAIRSFDDILSLILFAPQQKQDHYAVLGLSQLRYKATDEQIKIARKS